MSTQLLNSGSPISHAISRCMTVAKGHVMITAATRYRAAAIQDVNLLR